MRTSRPEISFLNNLVGLETGKPKNDSRKRNLGFGPKDLGRVLEYAYLRRRGPDCNGFGSFLVHNLFILPFLTAHDKVTNSIVSGRSVANRAEACYLSGTSFTAKGPECY